MSMRKFVPSTGTMRGLGSAGKPQSDERLNFKTPKIKVPKPKPARSNRRTPKATPQKEQPKTDSTKAQIGIAVFVFILIMGILMLID